jgi:Flp pilus assembly protein TadG
MRIAMLHPVISTLSALAQPRPAGNALIEFALLAPLFALMLAIVCDLGFAGYRTMQVQAAAEAGVEYAAVESPTGNWNAAAVTAIKAEVASATDTAGITVSSPYPTTVCGCAGSGSFTQSSCSVTCVNGDQPGLYAVVGTQLQYHMVMPYTGLPNPLVLIGQAYRRLN